MGKITIIDTSDPVKIELPSSMAPDILHLVKQVIEHHIYKQECPIPKDDIGKISITIEGKTSDPVKIELPDYMTPDILDLVKQVVEYHRRPPIAYKKLPNLPQWHPLTYLYYVKEDLMDVIWFHGSHDGIRTPNWIPLFQWIDADDFYGLYNLYCEEISDEEDDYDEFVRLIEGHIEKREVGGVVEYNTTSIKLD